MNFVIFFSDTFQTYNSSRWRASNLIKGLNASSSSQGKLYGMFDWQHQTGAGVAACSWADIIIIQRMSAGENAKKILYWQNKGKKVIIDYDDDYTRILPDNTAYGFWGKGEDRQGVALRVTPIEEFKRNIQAADAISTPSKLLTEDATLLGAKFALYVPNLIDTTNLPQIAVKPHTAQICLGWGGSMSHLSSWTNSGALEGVISALSARPNLKLKLVGDARVVSLFPMSIKDQLDFSDYVEHRRWLSALASTVDIGLAPLAGEYDCRRSHIKALEYGVLGMPYVATKSAPYEEFYNKGSLSEGLFIDQGETHRADRKNPTEWYTSILRVADNFQAARQSAASKVDNAIMEFSISQKNIDDIVRKFQLVQ